MSEMPPPPKADEGVPPWVMTFADLMTLLMCFFVLLLAFSEMDTAKFKELAGSMQDAFGVQAEVEVRTMPKGTSLIAREFSPGKPEPTAMNEIRQFTVDSNQNTLDAMNPEDRDDEIRKTNEHARRLREALKQEIDAGSIAIQTEGMKVIIHILENASFESGSDEIRTDFIPVLDKIAGLIDTNEGDIVVSGHTDNVPISNSRFRSNWELSTARAVSVAHELMQVATGITPARFMVTGHADTQPRGDNSTAEGRAANRRVDISVVRGNELDILRTVSVGDRTATATAATGDAASPTTDAGATTSDEETTNDDTR
jgi:chemotaxis protein MotB